MSASTTSAPMQSGLIIREREPLNLEYPFDQLDTFLTPNDLFYIRSHFKAPQLDVSTYRLGVGGAVERPFTITLDELTARPSITRPATLECAGNGRIFLVPQVQGAQWQLGAVSTAEWTGVPLSKLLERAVVSSGASEVVLKGADKGAPKEKPAPPGDTPYARSVSLEKAADVLIAYRMNGEVLPADHGFPLRAIVPGYYGMASVKWLTGITVVKEPFTGYWQTTDYAYWDRIDGNPVRHPLNEMRVKSAIARPRTREVVQAGTNYEVFGAAWSGSAAVNEVEVSTDGGESWSKAELMDREQPGLWRRWRFQWLVPKEPGVRILISRAKDTNGAVQPAERDEKFGTYAIHHTLRIEVIVR